MENEPKKNHYTNKCVNDTLFILFSLHSNVNEMKSLRTEQLYKQHHAKRLMEIVNDYDDYVVLRLMMDSADADANADTTAAADDESIEFPSGR